MTADQEEAQETGADGEQMAGTQGKKKGEFQFKIDDDEDCGQVQVVSTA